MADTRARISVITACYNAADTIERAVKSVLASDYPALEYVVIDGGSTDGTRDILERYRDRIDVLVSERDRGISDAFNKGIERCTGDIVGLVSADDYLPGGALERLADAARAWPEAEIYYGDCIIFDPDGSNEIVARPSDVNWRTLYRENPWRHGAVWVRQEAYERHGAFREDLPINQDYELVFRFFAGGARFRYVPEVLGAIQSLGTNQVKWFRSVRDAFRIRREYGSPLPLAAWRFVLDVARWLVRATLTRLGARRLLGFYRRFSPRFRRRD